MWPPHQYQRYASEAGMSEHGIMRALADANDTTLALNSAPPILTLGHLARATSVELDYLRKIVKREDDPYRIFRVRKRGRSKSFRTICIPSMRLLRVQRWLNRYVISRQSPHPASYAYDAGCSPVSCAREHLECRWLIRLDLRRFFDSISEIRIYWVFRRLGYKPLVAFELARLCTRVYKKDSPRYTRKPIERNPWSNPCGNEEPWGHGPFAHRLARPYRDSRVGHLPQGAPTSPRLSNLAVFGVDRELQEAATRARLVYTRYADDMYFSTASRSFTRAQATAWIRYVSGVLLKNGLGLNATKITIAPPGARRVVLGLLVDGPEPRLLKAFKKSLERHIHFIDKYGPTEHAHQRKFTSVLGMFEHLYGKVSYACSVEPEFGATMLARLQALDPKLQL